MMAACLGPHTEERREVPAVPRYDDPALVGGEGQDLGVGEAIELPLIGECEHMVALLAEPRADPAARQVRVEQEAHAATPER